MSDGFHTAEALRLLDRLDLLQYSFVLSAFLWRAPFSPCYAPVLRTSTRRGLLVLELILMRIRPSWHLTLLKRLANAAEPSTRLLFKSLCNFRAGSVLLRFKTGFAHPRFASAGRRVLLRLRAGEGASAGFYILPFPDISRDLRRDRRRVFLLLTVLDGPWWISAHAD